MIMNTTFTIGGFKESVNTALDVLNAVAYKEDGTDVVKDESVFEILNILQWNINISKDIETLRSQAAEFAEGQATRLGYDVTFCYPGGVMWKHNYNQVGNSSEFLFALLQNKMLAAAWMGYLSRIGYSWLSTSDSGRTVTLFYNTEALGDRGKDYREANHDRLKGLLHEFKQALVTPLTREELINGKVMAEDLIRTVKRRIDHFTEQDRANGDNGDKFSDLLQSGRVVEDYIIEEQLLEAYKLLPTNGLAARTWGIEVEVPDAKGVDAPQGFEKGEDGSLRSNSGDGCECSCTGCNYHDCDCDYCDNRSEGDEHCGSEYNGCSSADMAEFRTTGGIQRIISSGLNKLCKELNEEDAEMNDSAGTHIHVFAADLTTNQVGHVMAVYRRLRPIFNVICGRENVNYAKKLPIGRIKNALKKVNAVLSNEKPYEVNLMHLASGRGTIEFRQMDCNLDANRMHLWAWIVRGLVTAAKRGMRFNDALHVTDVVGVIELLAKFNVLLHDENPEEIIYGSKTDAAYVKRNNFTYA